MGNCLQLPRQNGVVDDSLYRQEWLNLEECVHPPVGLLGRENPNKHSLESTSNLFTYLR